LHLPKKSKRQIQQIKDTGADQCIPAKLWYEKRGFQRNGTIKRRLANEEWKVAVGFRPSGTTKNTVHGKKRKIDKNHQLTPVENHLGFCGFLREYFNLKGSPIGANV